jgi:hypothetical protein
MGGMQIQAINGRFKYQMHKLSKHFTEEVDGFIKMDTLSRSPV